MKKYLPILIIILAISILFVYKINRNYYSIKGNINSDEEKIYHLKNCLSYRKTIIEKNKGERWFKSEDEAIEAGWRKASNCN